MWSNLRLFEGASLTKTISKSRLVLFHWDIESSVKKINLNRDIAAQTGRQRQVWAPWQETARSWWIQGGRGAPPAPGHGAGLDCASSKQVGQRERAACGEQKVEKGNKRGRKRRGHEAIAVKWQWENDCRKASPCARKKKREKLEELLLVQKSAFPLYNQINYRNFWKQ